MKRRLLLPFAFVLSILAPLLAQGAVSAQSSKAAAPAPPAAAPCPLSILARARRPAGRAAAFCHSFYAISYSTTLRDPVWTSYRLTAGDGPGRRPHWPLFGLFRQDPALTAAQQGAHRDYPCQSALRPRASDAGQRCHRHAASGRHLRHHQRRAADQPAQSASVAPSGIVGPPACRARMARSSSSPARPSPPARRSCTGPARLGASRCLRRPSRRSPALA